MHEVNCNLSKIIYRHFNNINHAKFKKNVLYYTRHILINIFYGKRFKVLSFILNILRIKWKRSYFNTFIIIIILISQILLRNIVFRKGEKINNISIFSWNTLIILKVIYAFALSMIYNALYSFLGWLFL